MCGICGVASTSDQPDVNIVLRMMGQLAHRGPDGSGYLRDHGVALGHCRLSLIDFAGGAQPLSTPDRAVWVTFNGEIFNYVELADELRALGHLFTTQSDTEVIVHAWEQWGIACLERFNGQWALAIWDRRTRQLVLARDRLGVRPLYYRHTPGRLAFASEVKALFVDPTVPRALDPVGIDQTLTYWSTVAPRTPFAGVEQLPPGSYAVFDANGLRSERYWQPEFPTRGDEPSQDLATNSAQLRELLIRATRLRFERSDFPVGAYLSGGIDSSITAAVISNFTDTRLDTFSMRFADAEFDEGDHQRLMADRLGTHHSEVVVSRGDIAEVFPEVIWHAEAPILRTAPAPLFLLSKLVRGSGYKVVVTGEGADEVLGGYDIFKEGRLRDFWARNPDSALRNRGVELLYPWLARNPASTPAFARSFFGRGLDSEDPATSHRARWTSASAIKSMTTREMREAAADVSSNSAVELPDNAASWDALSRAQWLEMTTLLPGYILASQGDRMLMANSVEGRFPFLDRDVVQFANTLPARHKLFGMDEKFLLKHAFADLIPAEILDRPKQPYRAPDASAFFGADREADWLDDVVSSRALMDAGVFEPSQVAGLIAKMRKRRGEVSNTDNMRLVAVLSTQLIYSQFIAASRTPPSTSLVPQPVHAVDLISQIGEVHDRTPLRR